MYDCIETQKRHSRAGKKARALERSQRETTRAIYAHTLVQLMEAHKRTCAECKRRRTEEVRVRETTDKESTVNTPESASSFEAEHLTSTCPICMEECETVFESETAFERSDVGVLSCMHAMHKSCFKEYVTRIESSEWEEVEEARKEKEDLQLSYLRTSVRCPMCKEHLFFIGLRVPSSVAKVVLVVAREAPLSQMDVRTLFLGVLKVAMNLEKEEALSCACSSVVTH